MARNYQGDSGELVMVTRLCQSDASSRLRACVKVSVKLPGKLVIECDEMWSFVAHKKNEVYIWLAIDRNSRKIVGCYIGDRTRKSASKLWADLPEIYQQSDERIYRFLASVTLQLFPINVIEQSVKKQV